LAAGGRGDTLCKGETLLPPIIRRLLPPAAALVLALGAGAAFAQASVCAAFPETGKVARPAAAASVAPTPTGDRRLRCPDGFRLDVASRLPRCTRPGVAAVDGNPREDCYAALPLGPLAPVADRSRPTRTCPVRQTTSVVRLAGTNIGLSDVAVTVAPETGITVTLLADYGPDVAEAENPVIQKCFGFDCRLVRLDITARAAPVVELRLAVPGRDPVATSIKLPEYCER
jgi:hypothetical protein